MFGRHRPWGLPPSRLALPLPMAHYPGGAPPRCAALQTRDRSYPRVPLRVRAHAPRHATWRITRAARWGHRALPPLRTAKFARGGSPPRPTALIPHPGKTLKKSPAVSHLWLPDLPAFVLLYIPLKSSLCPFVLKIRTRKIRTTTGRVHYPVARWSIAGPPGSRPTAITHAIYAPRAHSPCPVVRSRRYAVPLR